ncbi:DNA-binding transcriptional regulator, MarR family [Geosporobacter subterraneus DSM 17957]|uniref:DNA-binding transcriptional regulator, MarR family n=1 Tax=Geosporobacter subterraneus DSM 17957 TaxID=1121919 RepID=A0A1M6CTM6_9FIRM|nr:MarR family transcriptional regulator [Geosporobacter subterraneus]SHI64243.1 DNA-binding transcriptional regulator, MarR family [Geosporobacter subterraneus DSM 17957]
MGNYYNEINRMMEKLIHKVLVYDRKGFKAGVKGEALSLLDLDILRRIEEQGCKKLYELVEEMEIDRGLISSCIQKLVLNSYLEKEKSKKDKRAYIVRLTELGRKMTATHLEKQKELLHLILDDMSLNEEKAILKFLSRVNQTSLAYSRKMEQKNNTP